jgi:purine nucleosidase
MPIPIVIDTDVGADPDDAIALALACASPELTLLGVTSVDGDVDLRARMAARLLGMAGRTDVPVVRGNSIRGTQMMGIEGRGLLDRDWAGHEATILDASAPEWLVETAKTTPFHLVVLGPHTNVAAAYRLDPEFARRLLGLTNSGGLYDEGALPQAWRQAIAEQGTDAWPDYNTMVDPEAALAVAQSGSEPTWITSEVTHAIPIRRQQRDQLAQSGQLGLALARMIDSWYEGWFREHMVAGANTAALPADAVSLLHDPLTLASLLPQSEAWLTIRPARLRYSVEDGLFRLRQTGDKDGVSARVSTAADADRFAAFCVERIARHASQIHPAPGAGGTW